VDNLPLTAEGEKKKMNWKHQLDPTRLKVVANAGGKADEILTNYLPKLRGLFIERIGPALGSAARDDEKMASLSKLVYTLLPFPVRLAVKKETFVRFCLTHRDRLVGDELQETLAEEVAPECEASVPPPLLGSQ
jgi:hypothetical protein